jgi:hypothetical protein
MNGLLTFVEDERFTAAADRLLAAGELFELMQKLARSPDAGDMIPDQVAAASCVSPRRAGALAVRRG